MKNIFVITLFLLLTISCNTNKKNIDELHNINYVVQNFLQPPQEYRTGPLWAWNYKITKPEIDFQLEELKEQGMGCVFIHPRPGMITEYLNDEWFEIFRYAYDKANSLGMKVWLYDENSYPSGFAGGHVQHDMPKSYNQGIALSQEVVNMLPEHADTFEYVLCKKDHKFLDITNDLEKYKNKKGVFYLYKKLIGNRLSFLANLPYPDLIVKGVTDTFLSITMPGYEKILGDEFGKNVPGIFSDEPTILFNMENVPNASIRWTPDLFSTFKKLHNYNLLTNLPSLLSKIEDWKKIRYDYYKTLLYLFLERWAKPYYKYCEENNLAGTGHYWEHEWPNPNNCVDNMAFYEYKQIPAIDLLFNNWEYRPDQFGNVRNVKEVVSIANQMGSQRVLSETYGGSSWDLSFKDMLRNGNWMYSLGINFMNQHLAYFSLTGTRKYDYPQAFSYQEPWWKHYRLIADYFARLSLALSAGEQINKALVIEPTSTAWMYSNYAPVKSDLDGISPFSAVKGKLDSINRGFTELITDLEKSNIEYDLGCEETMKKHSVITPDGKWQINKRKYDVIILPAEAETIYSETFDYLTQFVKNGGKVIQLGNNLEYLDAVKSEDIKDIRKNNNWTSLTKLEDLDKELNTYVNSEKVRLAINDSEIHFIRRIFQNGEIIFLMNENPELEKDIKLNYDYTFAYKLNLFDGKIISINADNHSIHSNILPAEGKLFLFTNKKLHNAIVVKEKELNVLDISTLKNIDVKRNDKNVLVLDYGNLEIEGKPIGKFSYFEANKTLFNHYGFNGENPFNFAVQYKDEIIKQDTFSVNTGFKMKYKFFINKTLPRSKFISFSLVSENTDIYSVSINGNILKFDNKNWWIDRGFKETNIGSYIHQGYNEVEVNCSPMSIFAEIEPVYIRGDFNVYPSKQGFVIGQTKEITPYPSWKDQGMPFYSSSVSYRFNVDKSFNAIKLPDWNGTIAILKNNDKIIDYFIFPGQIIQIDRDSEKSNEYELEIVGSLRNLWGPFFNGDLKGFVTPWIWRKVPEKQLSGKNYNFVDYGLIKTN